MTQLGKNHDQAVKEWRDSFLLDLAGLHEPSYQEQGEDNDSETSSSDYSSKEDDGPVDMSSSDSDSDCDFTSSASSTDDNEVNPVNQSPIGPLIVHPPQVLEPSIFIKILPGLPLQLRKKGFRLGGDNLDKASLTVR